MRAVRLEEIKEALAKVDVVEAVERGFVAYSSGRAVIPPVGELILERGEIHIKYGYIEGEGRYVIKVASGFFDNPSLGLPSGNGLMLVFNQSTGVLDRILLDEGHLTDVRTAAAGAIAARHLAPRMIKRIGILGTGVQARLQLYHLEAITGCRDVLVWGRNRDRARQYRSEVAARGFSASIAGDPDEVLRSCELIVTTTPSRSPLLHAESLTSGRHITAVGSDTPDKQELEPGILSGAELVVADSIEQCLLRGEIHHAIEAGAVERDQVAELGDVVAGRSTGRRSADDVTIADLTGVAVQDIQIANAVVDVLDGGS